MASHAQARQLNMAESELGVLASQCLDRRIADKQILTHEGVRFKVMRRKLAI
jgi:hypothetical protein